MSNTGLYVKLDPKSFERLRICSEVERRSMGDQAAVLLRDVLSSVANERTNEQRETVAA